MSADPVAPAESSAFWQSVQRAQAAVQSLSLILGSLPDAVASSENPAAALLNDEAVARQVSIRLRRPGSGAGDDNLCRWLYDTFQSNDPDLQLVVLTFTPTIAGVYLSRAISREPLAGFEAVLLALYAYETVIRGGDPETVILPNLANPSVYHEAKAPPKKGAMELNIAVVSPALEPYGTVRSTKRARIVGVALELYYSKISSMPLSSKLAFCEFCMVWAGQDIGTEGERSVSEPAGIAPAPAAEHVEEEALAAAGEAAAAAAADENGGKEEVGEKAATAENGGKEEGQEKAASAEADENGGKEECEEKAASAEADENGGKEEAGEKAAAAENGGKEEGEEKAASASAAADENGGKVEVGEKAAAAENGGKEEGEEKAASADENSGKKEGEEKAAAADENDGKEEGGEKTAAVGADENGGKDEGEVKAKAASVDKNGGKEAGEVKAGRIPLPWELFQPIVMIVGHCLLGPANPEELRTTAYSVVEGLHWRATHDMNPQEILATRSLLRLGKMGDDTIAEPQISTSSDDYSEEALKMKARLT
ncbi:Hyccin [Musa troglodytarum]|uniref:Hyccin n=1 Tax=Musa troglodytarum TaxID=320322 RepID=A0A9E7JLU6_9LILI|nr:Hyccin [Musa troglodytarum]